MARCTCPEDVASNNDPRLCGRCVALCRAAASAVVVTVSVDTDAVRQVVRAEFERRDRADRAGGVARRGIGW